MAKPPKDAKLQAEWLAAFGEPTRLALIRALAAGEKTVTNLAREVGAEMVNVSHHLSLLKDTGLVTVTRDGRYMIYALVDAKVVGTTLELVHSSGSKVFLPLE
ncbi:HTH-type transcriptional regulator NmtR [Gemmata sp. SH-PL17]|uniref:HTH arsR-type domain-containing protein n=1 Tax=Gemmata massiliana TaxID=1210884 RepID=A0A6P2CUA9_9BACT|nr:MULTISPECIES: metalloregulator ArsR/SmtB family transcription factor [Gemmata]AMV23733.1 HTH-type transcriptional regulator NmtR [Gemmata sp. SH-PL17]VTR91966.1 family transcriptional regulator : Putative ArsR family transcriptional regulator OS=Caldilinea aerophila (strain DSM 14535 / JCM 11387 / NBRC 104270 / STL-6-O1) GN=CLDAP_21180 PE=4 SV=1: HTH_20 [Gemmata massiliana]